MKSSLKFSAFVLLVGLAQAGLAQGYAYTESYHDTTFTFDPTVSSYLDPTTPFTQYTDGVNPFASGDGVNDAPNFNQSFNTDVNGNINEVTSDIWQDSYANTGSAKQFNGVNYFVDFKNNGSTTANVTFTDTVEQYFNVTGNAIGTAYAGWQYFDQPSNTVPSNFFTNGQNGDGSQVGHDPVLFNNPFPNYIGFTASTVSPGYIAGSDIATIVLQPGQTIKVEFWASNSTLVAPEPPVWLLGLLAVPLLLRRRS